MATSLFHPSLAVRIFRFISFTQLNRIKKRREREDFVSQSTRQLCSVFIIVFVPLEAVTTRDKTYIISGSCSGFEPRVQRNRATHEALLSPWFERNGLAESSLTANTEAACVNARTPVETRFEEAT